jgi:[ribosomal protein S18]-alanine N-acetyltransferase
MKDKMGQTSILYLEKMVRSDMKAVMEIERRCFEHAPWKNPNNFFNTPSRNAYSVRNGQGAIVGYVLIEGRSGDEVFTIFKMARHPDQRGTGIGPFILEKCRELATASNAKKLFLRVRGSNARAIRLYENAGFSTTREVSGYYRHGQTEAEKRAIEMELTLA